MGNRIVVAFPLLILMVTISLALSYVLKDSRIIDRFPILAIFRSSAMINRMPIDLKTNPDTLYDRMNKHRVDAGLPEFRSDPAVCNSYRSSSDNDPSQDDIFGICPNCIKASLIKIPKFATVEVIFAQLLNQPSIHETINNQELSLLCIKEDPEYLTLLLAAQITTSSTESFSPPITIVTVAPKKPQEFNEEELWAALTSYRRSHGVSELTLGESLCQYARSRVAEHIEKFANTAPKDYPVPEKYPLDAHSGFARDAESNHVFEMTGMNHIAENLAYWPTAESAVHIIEWGWDSSTEGHRETQLSNEFSQACISGSQGFFVAIFGTN